MMSKEELLQPRYKAIAAYPDSRFDIGDILHKYTFKTSETGMYTYCTNPAIPLQGLSLKKEYVETMPHLFQPLPWWSDRAVEDMPEYVKLNIHKTSGGDRVFKVREAKQFADSIGLCIDSGNTMDPNETEPVYTAAKYCTPATADEYEAWEKEN